MCNLKRLFYWSYVIVIKIILIEECINRVTLFNTVKRLPAICVKDGHLKFISRINPMNFPLMKTSYGLRNAHSCYISKVRPLSLQRCDVFGGSRSACRVGGRLHAVQHPELTYHQCYKLYR